MFRMRFCSMCMSYTMSESHCGSMAASAHPARFNPNDPYGDYRRKARFGA
jgi:rRNA maturation protein Nop10